MDEKRIDELVPGKSYYIEPRGLNLQLNGMSGRHIGEFQAIWNDNPDVPQDAVAYFSNLRDIIKQDGTSRPSGLPPVENRVYHPARWIFYEPRVEKINKESDIRLRNKALEYAINQKSLTPKKDENGNILPDKNSVGTDITNINKFLGGRRRRRRNITKRKRTRKSQMRRKSKKRSKITRKT